MAHVYPMHEQGHQPSQLCPCRPVPQIDLRGELVWLHQKLDDEADILDEAERIRAATSVELWFEAEKSGQPLQVIAFLDTNPIQYPKSRGRI